jgi:hypothetical protein
MDLVLRRKQFRADGIFGELADANGKTIAFTLEHAYDDGNGSFVPKVQPGVYLCERGEHQLEHMAAPFSTFEITGVEGHTNILFHWGNFNRDSSGCVLLGTSMAAQSDGTQMITASRAAFEKFMNLQSDIPLFYLLVI